MQIKSARLLPIGVNQDLADSRFNSQQFLYDAYNIRFTAVDSNTSLIIENEKGNLKAELTDPAMSMEGVVIGHCVCDKDLIIFTTGSGEDGGNIYRLTAAEEEKFNLSPIWTGRGLNFDKDHPIEAIYVYETESIKKVYFVDGKNTAKFFNVVNPPSNLNDFEFSPIITGDESFSVEKLDSGGQFTAGTVQYAFSYYNINGAETALVDISPLQYPSFKDRAGKEGEIVDSSFSVTINNLDTSHYQYIRLYAIERSSIDTETKVRYMDVAIESSSITVIDNGVTGYDYDATNLLFTGGESLIVGTIAAKDGVLFAGNISLVNASLKDLTVNPLRVSWATVHDRVNIESFNTATEQVYVYKPFASSNRHFKYRQLYRFGFQIQYSNGRWSEVRYIGNDTVCTQPLQVSNTTTTNEKVYGYFPTIAKFTLSPSLVNDILSITDNKAIKVRPVMVPVTINDKNVLSQGLLTNTIFNLKEKLDGQTIGYSDYLFRPIVPSRANNLRYIPVGDFLNNLPYMLGFYAGNSPYGQYALLPFANGLDAENTNLVVPHNYEFSLSQGGGRLTYGMDGTGSLYDPFTIKYNESEDLMNILWHIDRSLVDFWSPDLQYSTDRSLPDEVYITSLQEVLSTRDRLEYVDVTTSGTYVRNEDNVSTTLDYSVATSVKPGGRFPNKSIVGGYRRYTRGHSNESQGPTPAYAAIAMWNAKQVTAGGGNGTDEGSIKISKKAQGRLAYLGNIMPLKYPDYDAYQYSVVSPTISENDTTSSDIAISPITIGEESASYFAGMNKILPNDGYINAVQWSIFIRYKTATHMTFGLTSKHDGRVPYALPIINDSDLTTKWYTNPVTKQDVVAVPISISSQFNGTTNSETTGYAIIADIIKNRLTPTGSSQFGGSESRQITYDGESSPITTLVANPSALLNNIWVPCGKAVRLYPNTAVTLECTEGDTFLQRYDCLRVEPINKVSEEGEVSADSDNNYQSRTEVVSFLCETQINLDGRWDRNRYNTNVVNMTSSNYNRVNLAYSQLNNLFNYKTLDYRLLNQNVFRTSFTWSTQKLAGEAVDPWTSLSLATINDASGSYGPIRKLITYNNELYGFQDKGVFNILFNNRVQVATSDNLPIEITNNNKVQGVRYLSNTKGTLDRLSVGIGLRGVYFVDNYNRTITRFMLGEGFQDISISKGMKSWSFNNIISKEGSSYTDSENFNVFVDMVNSNVYFINKGTCLCFNETLDVFTGFYSYEDIPLIVNMAGDTYSATNTLNPEVYLQHKGKYNEFFNIRKESTVTYKVNPEPFGVKIFNNIAFICDCFNIPESMDRLTEHKESRIIEESINPNNRIIESIPKLDRYGNPELIYSPNRCLNHIAVWTEYQSGEADLVSLKSPANLKKKFRVWRAIIPRHHNTMQRINNPWMNMKLTLTQNPDENMRMLLHNMEVSYTM